MLRSKLPLSVLIFDVSNSTTTNGVDYNNGHENDHIDNGNLSPSLLQDSEDSGLA